MDADSLCAVSHKIAGYHHIHGSQRERPRAGAGGLENLDVRGRGNAQRDAMLLHLAVEDSTGNPGDLHFGVQHLFAFGIRIAPHFIHRYITTIDKHLHVVRGAIAEFLRLIGVNGANDAANRNQNAVVLDADQLSEGGRRRLRQLAVAEHGDLLADDDGAEAAGGLALDQYAISGMQHLIRFRIDIDAVAIILHEERIGDLVVEGHRRFECDRQLMIGLFIAESGNLAQRGQRTRRRRSPCKRGPSEYERNCWNHSS